VAIPDGITNPVIEVALATVYVVIGVIPKTTADTVLAEEPPKKPVPVTATVVGVKLLPVPAVIVATVGAEVVTVNFTAEVAFVPPGVVTFTLYVPTATPVGITAPMMLVSVITAAAITRAVFAVSDSLTEATVELAVPPKNPVPAMLTVTGDTLLPVLAVTFATVGAGAVVVKTNFTALVAFVPVVVVTLTSYVPAGFPDGTTAFTIFVSFATL